MIAKLVPHRRIRRARRVTVACAAAVAVLAVPGCGLTVEKVPLPKPGPQGDTYTVHAVFTNALNLPDQAKVKIGGSDVGVVTHIETKNYQAVVDMKIRKDIQLPKDTTAELRQATPLGDVFVAVAMPKAQPGTDLLRNGDTLPVAQTSAGATVEELLLSVSTLFNGGGLSALTKVTAELDSIVGGRPDQLANLLRQMTSVTTTLHANSDKIDSTLNGFGALANTIEQRHNELGQVADTLPGMIGTIAENNKQIGDLLSKVSTTSAALGDYADTSTTQLSSLLENVHKLMDALAQTRNDFEPLLDAMHDVRPAVDASFKGNVLAVAATLTQLDIGLITDPAHSKFYDLRDAQDMVGSLIQVLQIVQGRVGGHR
ncbi:virulence factor Mce-like protein [Nocardia transvalensis]|uniref:Virulence factor Mce-like protein n=1 Tax=Nocardia transvalensis TaxID=37333 RepID=A0A7W9UHW9_9NOCA|nr:MlaD family protein [Nocardia transvalensis]MBB5913819.1 virulence factor Mce-like protein [Nocardia transvalensis]